MSIVSLQVHMSTRLFRHRVLATVRLIPPGRVMSYGQIAAYVGMPRAARQVGWVMRSLEGVPDFPWWRVLNNTGRITIKGNYHNTPRVQKELLEAEGVVVGADMMLDIEHYRFRADLQDIRTALHAD